MMQQTPFAPEVPYNELPPLPPLAELDSKAILKATIPAAEALTRLARACHQLSNPRILVETLTLQEAQVSSEIEHIVTTQDELYKALADATLENLSRGSREVLRYREALFFGMEQLAANRPFASNLFISIMQRLRETQENIRAGEVKLANDRRGHTIYTPPVGEDVIRTKLKNLEDFYHDETLGLHPLIRMAVAHYQFEAIHPFSDGNGRTGRILNILFLVNQQLLSEPVLYLSAYFLKHSADYYRLLQKVTTEGAWEEWILYVLEGVRASSLGSVNKIDRIIAQTTKLTEDLKAVSSSIPAHELALHLQERPYTKIRLVERSLNVHYQTARRYLDDVVKAGILTEQRLGREQYYINHQFLQLLATPLITS